MTDATAYDADTGVLRANNIPKCVTLPTLGAALSCIGPFDFAALFAVHMTHRFTSFDEVIRAPEFVVNLFLDLAHHRRNGDTHAGLYMIGWSTERRRPAAYFMQLWTDECSDLQQMTADSSLTADTGRFKFEETEFSGSPIPPPDLRAAAGFDIPNDLDDMDPAVDLLHLMEVQRHEKIRGHHWVGGKALLTSIDQHGIQQRVVQHWSEDEIGKPISPSPIDWARWRREHKAGTVVKPRLWSQSKRKRA